MRIFKEVGSFRADGLESRGKKRGEISLRIKLQIFVGRSNNIGRGWPHVFLFVFTVF